MSLGNALKNWAIHHCLTLQAGMFIAIIHSRPVHLKNKDKTYISKIIGK
jgi:hypothetical protein